MASAEAFKDFRARQQIVKALEPKGKEFDAVEEKVKTGRHFTVQDSFDYLAMLSAAFVKEGTVKDMSPAAEPCIEVVLKDFQECVEQGSLYRKCVKAMKQMGDNDFQVGQLGEELERNLRGEGIPEAPYPALLSVLWALRETRPTTYRNSMNAAKWAVPLAISVDDHNEKNNILGSDGKIMVVEPAECFVYTLAQNMGMMSPNVPYVENGRTLAPDEFEPLRKHGHEGHKLLLTTRFDMNGDLPHVIQHHATPQEYSASQSYDPKTAIVAGICAVAEAFEAMMFARKYRSKKFTTDKILENLLVNLFGAKGTGDMEGKLPRDEVDDYIKNLPKDMPEGHYGSKMARKYPTLQPYQRLAAIVKKAAS